VPARGLNAEIDKLYQLPLDEFTAARNALAREAGAEGAEIRRLSKPPLAAWAVNQLYWKDRSTWDALIAASNELRGAHKAVLGGRRSDLRSASKVHDEALDAALKATLQLLKDAGQNTTDATKQAILNTLRALPSTDPPGRLGRALQPGGFEMLAGLPLAAGTRTAAVARPSPPAAKTTRGKSAREDRAAAAARKAAAREALAEAAREAREADTHLRRQEFAVARAAKEAENAARRVDDARQALEEAQRDLEEAERAAVKAKQARERASREAEEAQEAAESARARLEAAQAEAAEAE
jgi:DNA repair exonuclease SbcCD ATPase subunit